MRVLDQHITVHPGRYVVAVSGGIDSMVLLHLLHSAANISITAVHVNHGIRPDSDQDQSLVEAFCKSHNIEYVTQRLNLGQAVSEAQARSARYKVLQQCRITRNADAIITAHHKDDLLETAIINIIRGTGWRGIAPFTNSNTVVRPLLHVAKEAIIRYAAENNVPWRQDSTNLDQRYLRNYVRLSVMPELAKQNPNWEQDFLRLIRKQQALRRTIEDELATCLTSITKSSGHTVSGNRYDWIMLPPALAYECLQTLCRRHCGNSLERAQAELAMIFIKVARPGKVMVLNDHWQIRATMREFIVESRLSMVK